MFFTGHRETICAVLAWRYQAADTILSTSYAEASFNKVVCPNLASNSTAFMGTRWRSGRSAGLGGGGGGTPLYKL